MVDWTLDTVHYGSVLIDGKEWGRNNHCSLKFDSHDSIINTFQSGCYCSLEPLFCGIYYDEVRCEEVYFDSTLHLFANIYPWGINCNLVSNSFRYQYEVVDAGNVCPQGWHVATDTDWQDMVDFCGGNECAALRLKINSPAYWWSYEDVDFDDYSGLKLKSDLGAMSWEYTLATWWSPSADAPPGKMWIRKITSNSPKVYRYLVDESEYHSVRCVKNQ
jgi:uncharacterized protein (TIGR02145 family)